MLGVHAAPAAGRRPAGAGRVSVASASTGVDRRQPRRAQRRRVDHDAGHAGADVGSAVEQLVVYGQSWSTAACMRRCDSSVPSPSRTSTCAAWSRWYADSLRALAAIAASRSSPAPPARRRAALVGRQEQQLGHGDARSRRWAARPAARCGTRRSSRRYASVVLVAAARPPARRRRSAAAGPRRAGRGRCWPARCPLPSPARAGDHSPSRCAAISASSPRPQDVLETCAASQVVRPFRHLVEGGVPVDLVGGRVEEGVLLVGAATR